MKGDFGDSIKSGYSSREMITIYGPASLQLGLAAFLFVLVTGIADSSYLVKFLKDRNLVFTHLKYKDHYNYSKSSVNKIKRISEGKYILTTEKDFGKLKLKVKSKNLFYIEVGLNFINDNNELSFDNLIEKYVKEN